MAAAKPASTKSPTFQQLQTQGNARPPQPNMYQASGSSWGSTPGSAAPPQIDQTRPPPPPGVPRQIVPPSAANPPSLSPASPPQLFAPSPMPDLEKMYTDQYGKAYSGSFGRNGQSNISAPGAFGYQSFNGATTSNYDPGSINSHYDPGAYTSGSHNLSAPGVFANAPTADPRAHFAFSGGPVGGSLQSAVLQALSNPSRYGSAEAGKAFDLLNRQLTQAGTADEQRINEEMARRGIYASSIAGGRLGDLATNLNNQRADFATNIALDQARQYQTDRSSAIADALGLNQNQFTQALQGFGANQQAGQQAFDQRATSANLANIFGNAAFSRNLDANRFNEDRSMNAYNQGLARNQFQLSQDSANFGRNLDRSQFKLAQDQQNYGQRANDYGLNLQGQNQNFNQNLANRNFQLNQAGQNYNNAANTFGLNTQAQNQGFQQQLASLMGLQGFGQQSFQNQMAVDKYNNDLQQQQWDNNYKLLGLT